MVGIDTGTAIFALVFSAGIVLGNNGVNVWQKVVDICVDTGILSQGTANTKGDNTSEDFEFGMLSEFVL